MKLLPDKIHVVLAVYDPCGTYSRHAGVVLVSMFSNTKSSVCVHILHDETLNEDSRNKLIELVAKFGQELNFIDAGEHIGKLRVDADKLTHVFSRGSLFRLFIQDLLPVDKVIYLDCDVIVELDIKELWDVDLGDCKVGVVLDFGEITQHADNCGKRRAFFCGYAGIGVKKYFNSGVLLLDLKKIRNMDMYSLASEFFLRYPDTFSPDQDFLNKIFQESALEIDRKFNYFGKDINYLNMNGKLWHFAARIKPWDLATNLPIDTLYWQYLGMTPWGNDLIIELTKAWAKSRFNHVHSSDCCKTLWQKLKENLSSKNITPLHKIVVIWHDITYRIRKKIGI